MMRLRDAIFRANDAYRDEWIEASAKRLPMGSRVLDMGAGTCRHKPRFAHCWYEAQDFCRYEPDAGTSDDPSWSYGMIDYVCDATSVPLPDGSFDAVLCSETLEHVPRPAAVVREAARLLKPGGTLMLTAPLGSGLHMMPHHYFGGFTPSWYHRVLAESGCEQVEIEANGGFFRMYGQESQRFAHLLSPLRLRAPLWAKALAAPLWAVLWPVMGLLLPTLCAWLDRYDSRREFTVGYFVYARRGQGLQRPPSIL